MPVAVSVTEGPIDTIGLLSELSKDGASARSPTLVYECALDENGSLVDDDCKNRFEFTFAGNQSVGLWNVSYMKSINGTLTETLYGSVIINEDVHLDANHTHENTTQPAVESQSTGGNDSMIQTAAIVVAIVSALGVGVILMQPEKKTLVEEE